MSRPCIYRTAAVYSCPSCSVLQLETFDHDCYPHSSDEPWDMCFRHRVTMEHEGPWRARIARCPTPEDSLCVCEAHVLLRSIASTIPIDVLSRLPKYGDPVPPKVV